MFNKYASSYQEQYMSVDLYEASLNEFCKNIPKKNATILDVGCGPGNVTQYLLKQRSDFNILGIDFAPNMISLAKKNNPTASFKVMDAKSISDLNKKYQGIVCAFLLPYLSKENTIKLIEVMTQLLNKDGVLYISTMEDINSNSKLQSTSQNKDDQLFINYHEIGYITEAIKENGLTIVFSTLQEFPQKQGKKTTDLIIVAKK